MNNPGTSETADNLKARAQLFRALGHPARLVILNLLRKQPRHGEELAVILNLQPATISHHLAQLSAAGLVVSQRDQYYQTYSLVSEALDRNLGDLIAFSTPGLTAGAEEDAYETKVLRTFVQCGRLVSIPVQRKKRQVILAFLAERFEPGRAYTELQVNQVLVEFHEDVATLRRELVSYGHLAREHGVYRRAEPAAG